MNLKNDEVFKKQKKRKKYHKTLTRKYFNVQFFLNLRNKIKWTFNRNKEMFLI